MIGSISIAASDSQFTEFMKKDRINVWLIRAFEGPRHARLEAIWNKFAELHKDQIHLNIFENKGAVRRHDECLEEIWSVEKGLPESRAIITEFDFLPFPSFVQWPTQNHGQLTLREPIQAAEYCVRDPVSKKLRFCGIPGAWFIRISKALLRSTARLCYTSGGPFNDPTNQLDKILNETSGQRVRLLQSEDCYPRHCGVRVLGAGEHLFWARHYNDNPLGIAAGFRISEILDGVDKAIDDYERKLNAATKS
jgi:hypothetical protein